MNIDLSLCKDKRVCVAVSGGGDSVALLHYCRCHAREYGMTLSAVHCEHGIRGESSLEDSRFVTALCTEWNIPLFSYAADCLRLAREEKVSVETAARAFRYRCFDELLAQDRADVIATAHHMRDEAETVLFRLSRGCALTGAGGIRNRAGYARPLLAASKEEIEAYLQENRLAYRTDESNADERYTRNAIRLRALPVLEEIVPGATANIARFAERAREDDSLLYRLAEGLVTPLKRGQGYSVLNCKERSLFSRACLLALKRLGVERDYTRLQLDGLYTLQTARGGAKLSLPAGLTGVAEYDRVTLYRAGEQIKSEEVIPFSLGLFTFGDVNFSVTRQIELKSGHGYIDLNKVPSGAVFRTRREGDVFRRRGGGRKKLKDYLIDQKIPARRRDELVFLADGGEILAVVGGEVSERVKTESGSDVAQIYVSPERE